MTHAKKIESLTTFLKIVTTDENLFIYNSDGRCGSTFAVAEKQGSAVNTISNFMTYKEMNCYFFGILAVQQNKIKNLKK